MPLKLLLHNDDWNSFSHAHMLAFLRNYFDIVIWQPGTDYSRDHVLVVDSFKLHRNTSNFWYQPYLKDGYKILVDNMWEIPNFINTHFPDSVATCHVMQNTNWFWYNESIMYQDQQLNQYRPNKTYDRLALMPMRIGRGHRRDLVIELSSVLDNLIWSFNAHGRQLPDDLPQDHPDYQRHFNPAWYDRTHFSIVAESQISNPEMFVTEKTFKPMAFYHPFVVMGQTGILNYLRTQGFETFNNLFDETYDTITDYYTRLLALVGAVKRYNCVPYDTLTHQKLAHNHNRFFDQKLVQDRFVKEIVEPIIHYAESR
jgi:hypothetical protein